ncbi:Uncharacterized protein Rs2_03496 [Raphanus sativus]|nr:Uncharacterized protein Rs2_03496 [Raphanus sativus]
MAFSISSSPPPSSLDLILAVDARSHPRRRRSISSSSFGLVASPSSSLKSRPHRRRLRLISSSPSMLDLILAVDARSHPRRRHSVLSRRHRHHSISSRCRLCR